MVRGWLSDGSDSSGINSFWIKWCPHADPRALDQSMQHMRWWSKNFPQLAQSIPKLMDHWPHERVLLIEGVEGVPVGEALEDDCVRLQLGVRSLARWHRGYAEVGNGDFTEMPTMLGSEVHRTSAGQLHVRADRLIEERIALAAEAAYQLSLSGCKEARQWSDRYDLSGIVSKFSSGVNAGFIHGDFKPDNVLIDGDSFSVIDWWTAPRVSWPLTDVAVFAANLWMDPRREPADQVWQTFVEERFEGNIQSVDRQAIDVLATMTCLQYLAYRCKTTRSIDRVYGRRALERLLKRRHPIGMVRGRTG